LGGPGGTDANGCHGYTRCFRGSLLRGVQQGNSCRLESLGLIFAGATHGMVIICVQTGAYFNPDLPDPKTQKCLHCNEAATHSLASLIDLSQVVMTKIDG
jgi:hypothetical protein